MTRMASKDRRRCRSSRYSFRAYKQTNTQDKLQKKLINESIEMIKKRKSIKIQ